MSVAHGEEEHEESEGGEAQSRLKDEGVTDDEPTLAMLGEEPSATSCDEPSGETACARLGSVDERWRASGGRRSSGGVPFESAAAT